MRRWLSAVVRPRRRTGTLWRVARRRRAPVLVGSRETTMRDGASPKRAASHRPSGRAVIVAPRPAEDAGLGEGDGEAAFAAVVGGGEEASADGVSGEALHAGLEVQVEGGLSGYYAV